MKWSQKFPGNECRQIRLQPQTAKFEKMAGASQDVKCTLVSGCGRKHRTGRLFPFKYKEGITLKRGSKDMPAVVFSFALKFT